MATIATTKRSPTRTFESVTTEAYRSGIPVDGMAVLRGLLVKYMGGSTSHSGATTSRGGFGTTLLALARQGNEMPFLKRLFDEIDANIKSRGFFEKHYDYDGQGPFFKTGVGVTSLKGESYVPSEVEEPLLLTLYAAYVGGKVEEGLAEAIGSERGLAWAKTVVTLPASGPTATVDIAKLLDPIRSVLGLPTVKAARIAEMMMPKDQHSNFGDADIKLLDGDIFVSIGIDSLSFLPTYRPEQTIVRQGSCISGTRHENFDRESRSPLPLRVNVTVTPHHLWRNHDWKHVPEVRPAFIAKILDLNQRIAAAYMAVA